MDGIPLMGIPRAGVVASLAGLISVAAWAGTAVSDPIHAAAGGIVVGTITTKEAAPRQIRVTIDPGACGESLPDESVTVGAAGALANAVVTAVGVKIAAPPEAAVTNQKCAFVPHVSMMRPNGTIKMVSRDPMIHTMHAADP